MYVCVCVVAAAAAVAAAVAAATDAAATDAAVIHHLHQWSDNGGMEVQSWLGSLIFELNRTCRDLAGVMLMAMVRFMYRSIRTGVRRDQRVQHNRKNNEGLNVDK